MAMTKKTSGTSKSEVIRILFLDKERWNENDELIRPAVTLTEVQQAIEVFNSSAEEKDCLSIGNPANFFKDFIRNVKSAEKNWPEVALKKGYTAVQWKGKGNCFIFQKIAQGQSTAFSATAAKYPKNPMATKFTIIQTLSLGRFTKTFSRNDENWLQKIAVDLHIPQTHLALHIIDDLPFNEVGIVQSNIKLNKTEIDGLYYGYLSNGGIALITMEAKGPSDDILESQIIDQVEAIQKLKSTPSLIAALNAKTESTLILPMAMKIVSSDCAKDIPNLDMSSIVGNKLLYLVHFDSIKFNGTVPKSLNVLGETFFDLRPSIPGVTSKGSTPKVSSKASAPSAKSKTPRSTATPKA